MRAPPLSVTGRGGRGRLLVVPFLLAACAFDPVRGVDADGPGMIQDGAITGDRGSSLDGGVDDRPAPVDVPGPMDLPAPRDGVIDPDRAMIDPPPGLDGGTDTPTADAATDCPGTDNDPSNCGACGRRCCGGWCFFGHCGTEGPPGTASCPSSAEYQRANRCSGPLPVQTFWDARNCGGCGHTCADGDICVSGGCRAP